MRKAVDPTCSTPHFGSASQKPRGRKRWLSETLRSVGMSLQVVKGTYPAQFSVGELQRVSIAMALITGPS
jgi:ABC-type glutathione transport system ATPase component